MNIKSGLLLGASAFILVVSFNNCSDVAFSPMDDATGLSQSGDPTPTTPDDPTVPGVPTTPVQIAKKCDNMEQSQQRVSVSFPEPANYCDWGMDGNNQPKNEYFQARREQDVEFALPSGATICDIKFNFSPQSFYFDDHIVLAMNDRILASSYNWNGILSRDNEGLAIYDWKNIVGQKWVSNSSTEGTFCAGKDQGLSTCSWPATQTQGTIKMNFDKAIIQKVMAASVGLEKQVFTFVTIGDDDKQRDCKHSPIQFTVDVKYVK